MDTPIEKVLVPEHGADFVADNWVKGEKSSDEEIAVVSSGKVRFTGLKFGKVDVLRDGEVIYSFDAVQYAAAEVPKVEEITVSGVGENG